MVEQPMEVVFALLEARRRHDIDAVAELLDPAVVHEGVTADLVCHDRDQVLHNVRRSFQRSEEGVDHLELVAAGESVILGVSGRRFEGAPWTETGAQLFIVHTVRSGRVVRMRDFVARDAAFQAAGVDPVDWT